MYSGLYASAKLTAPDLYSCLVESFRGLRSSPVDWVKNWAMMTGLRPSAAASCATTRGAPLGSASSAQSPDHVTTPPACFAFVK